MIFYDIIKHVWQKYHEISPNANIKRTNLEATGCSGPSQKVTDLVHRGHPHAMLRCIWEPRT